MGLGESDTRAKLIDPALHARGWTEDLVSREETAGTVEIVDGRPRRRARGRVDYTLRVKVNLTSQPVAVALIEAKAEDLPPTHGLEQGRAYADSRRLNVPFVFSSNGHLFVEYDRFSGQTTAPRTLGEFPTPDDLRNRYEQGMGFSLEAPQARPLLARYLGGEATRRYYQDAAIRAVLEKIARGDRRALLSLATGSGKTFIAVNLLKRIADAAQLRRALFVCDRDELRTQGLGAFHNVFGADAAAVSSDKPQKNARILIATYQTLDVDTEDADANFLTTHYPENYFSHIVIDECHRSAWGKWSQVLTRNPDAVQIGLTATPREITLSEKSKEGQADAQISADNLRYFGEPVYEYDMAQGIEDGYLAACEIIQRDIFLDDQPQSERETGVGQADLQEKVLHDANTGEVLAWVTARTHYEASNFEGHLLLPDRIPFLFVRNIVGGRIDFNVEKHVSYVTYEKLVRACRPERGDVLYSAVGSFGVAVVVDTDRPFTFQRHIAHIKPRRDLVEPYFLCSYLNSPEGRRESDAAALGGAQRTVTLGSLAGFEVPIPAIEIQRRIAASVTAWSAKLEVIRAQVEEQVASISTLPAAFLRQAFSGEL